jgi:hypothetical protein
MIFCDDLRLGGFVNVFLEPPMDAYANRRESFQKLVYVGWASFICPPVCDDTAWADEACPPYGDWNTLRAIYANG